MCSLHFPRNTSQNAYRQWLIEVPAGKQALLDDQERALFLQFVAVLDAALGAQMPAIKDWHERRQGGRGHEVEEEQTTATAVAGPEPSISPTAGASMPTRKGVRRDEAALPDLSTAVDCCSEVLKAASCLMSLTE